MSIKVVESPRLSKQYDKRYEIVDADTGEVLDNAQGYGYKDIRGAYVAWGYKHRDKKKDAEKRKRYAAARAWLKQHKNIQVSLTGAHSRLQKVRGVLTTK